MCDNSPKKRYNLQKCGSSCFICKSSRRKNHDLKLFKFPPSDTIIGKIWREKCKIEEENTSLFICSKHFPIEYLGTKRLRSEAIPSLFLNDEEDAVDEFFDVPEGYCEIEGICNGCEKNLKAVQFYNKKYLNLLKKYKKLYTMYKSEKRKMRYD